MAFTSARSRLTPKPGWSRSRATPRLTMSAVNPLILHGQTHGGIAQGMGHALLEQCVYDPGTGQLLTGSFMDYAMPRAADRDQRGAVDQPSAGLPRRRRGR